MKVLLIGGCGFIGSHVVGHLVSAGIEVRVFDRAPERFRPPLPGVDYVQGDVTDLAAVYEAMADVDALVHLASATVPATANLDPVGDISGNLVTMVRLLEAMRSVGLRRIVYLSSGERSTAHRTHLLSPKSTRCDRSALTGSSRLP